ncbi:MAG: adenine deaminase [Candidatus Aminicenantes bacterium]|nr:adenine deaminase [Candidatus Aminicenantes bacterium]
MYDLILTNGNIINVRSKQIYQGNILIQKGIIVGIDTSQNKNGKETIDIKGKYVAPGFIDSHLHIESSMLSPIEFSREAVKHGTTTLFVDPHEIANVCGRKGIDLFLRQSDVVPLDMFVGIPSCVPATQLEDSGASITIEDIKELLPDRRIFGLAEMMNFPGIIYDLGDAREKVDIAFNAGKIVDGHCPGVSGEDLKKYISNGKNDGVVRIMSDHESTRFNEVVEKHNLGMNIALRYGSATKDLERILPELIKTNFNLDRFMFCSDDLDPIELYETGHIDRIIRKAIHIIQENSRLSLEQAAILAISLATINPAQYFSRFFQLHNYPETGEIAVGKKANLVVLDSLENVKIDKVIYNGALIVDNKEYAGKVIDYDYSEFFGKVNTGKKFLAEDFKINTPGNKTSINVKVIEIIKGSIVTKQRMQTFTIHNEEIKADPEKDIAKIAVIERHKATGFYSLGLVKGLGIKKGAIASTVAHDSHNLIVAGANDESMAKAVNYLSEKGGGMVVTADKMNYFPLKIAGLMSTSRIEKVVDEYKNIKKDVKIIGSRLENTFMTMAFLALPVIPKLKITNRGLVDVNKFELVNLF